MNLTKQILLIIVFIIAFAWLIIERRQKLADRAGKVACSRWESARASREAWERDHFYHDCPFYFSNPDYQALWDAELTAEEVYAQCWTYHRKKFVFESWKLYCDKAAAAGVSLTA